MCVAEAKRILDAAERDRRFAAGCSKRHQTGEFQQVTKAALVYHTERVRLAREAWQAAMKQESGCAQIFQEV